MFKYLTPQGRRFHMSVNLGGAYAFVAEHLLDYAQVGAALEQCRGKGVAKCVRADSLGDAGLCGLPLYHYQNHRAGEMRAPAVQEHIVFLTGFDFHDIAVNEP